MNLFYILACDIPPSTTPYYFGEDNRVIHYHGAKAAEPSIVFEDFNNTESYYQQYRSPTGQFFFCIIGNYFISI